MKTKFNLALCMTLIISSFALWFMFGLNPAEENASADMIGSLPSISAFLEEGGVDGGTLSINGINVSLDGTDPYEYTSAGSSVTIVASAKEHYQFVKSTIYEDQEGVFVESAIQPGVGESSYNFTLAATDYKIVVEFKLKEYTLKTNIEYYDNRGVDISDSIGNVLEGEVFRRTDAAASSDAVTLGMSITFQANTLIKEYQRFAFCEILDRDGNPLSLGLSNNYTITFGEGKNNFNLTDYANDDGEIWIVGVYVKTFLFKVNTPDILIDANSFSVTAISPIQEGGSYKSYSGGNMSEWLDQSTDITIHAADNDYYEFINYTINGSENNDGYQTFFVMEDKAYVITANFKPIDFVIKIEGMGSDGKPVDLEGDFYAIVDGNRSDTLRILEKLEDVIYSDVEGYVFKNIIVKRWITRSPATNDFYDAFGEEIATDTFLSDHHSDYEIVIVINFIKQYSLTINVPPSSAGYGNYNVWVVGHESEMVTLTQSTVIYFNLDDVVKVKANAKGYCKFNFSAVSANELSDNIATLEIKSEKTINISFNAIIMTIGESADENIQFSIKSFKADDYLYITYNVPENKAITKWKINGKKHSELVGNVTLKGNVLTIKLTADFLNAYANWFEGNTFVINNEVSVGLQMGLLLTIALPIVAVPVLLAVLVVFIVINSKRKKAVRKLLTNELQTQIVRDIGGFISDLKEGKVTGVNDAAVKKAMKEKKYKK